MPATSHTQHLITIENNLALLSHINQMDDTPEINKGQALQSIIEHSQRLVAKLLASHEQN